MSASLTRTGQIVWLRLAILLAVAALTVGCDLLSPPKKYQPTPIPEDVTRLFRVHGDTSSDTVWIYEQGGPVHSLIDDPLSNFENFPDREHIHLVQVHQTLTLNHDLASRYEELSLQDLTAEVDVSVEILHRAIRHFRAEEKRVVVLGHSYGAFLVTRYLALKGAGGVDRFVIMAGRLDLPAAAVDGALNGVWHYFPGGGDPVPHPTLQPTNDQDFIEIAMVGATGHDRYTERLADTDLRRVIYVYGTADEQVGRLSDAEVSFLQRKKSTVITIQGGDHGAMFADPDVTRQIVDALQQQP